MPAVLHLRSSGGKLGAESVIIELCKFSKNYNFKTIIGAIKNKNTPKPDFLKEAGLFGMQTVEFEGKSSFDFKLILAIRTFIKKNEIDIVHCHGYKEDFYGFFASLKLPVKIIATNHLWKDGDFKERIYRKIDQAILRFFDKVVAVSNEIKKSMNEAGIKNIVRIDNGIDTDLFKPIDKNKELLKQFHIEDNLLTFGMISSLTKEKGHELAIEVFGKIKDQLGDFKLIIIGDGVLKESLKQQVVDNGIANQTIFTGKRTDIPDLLSIIDIYILTSHIEGLPMSLLEAMAAGKVAIASDVGEISNVIEDNQNGILIPPGNADILLLKILMIVSDTEVRKGLSVKSRKTVLEKFSSQAMTMRYCDLYTKAIIS